MIVGALLVASAIGIGVQWAVKVKLAHRKDEEADKFVGRIWTVFWVVAVLAVLVLFYA
jgi:ATP/ADP translocase